MSIDRRKQVIEAATQSFALFGYKATTMDQVAKIAKVGKGTIYTFFTNKEELFDEIMNHMILEMKHVADAEFDPNRSFFENLNCILSKILDFRDQHELALKLTYEVRDMGTPQAIEGITRLENAIVSYIQRKVQNAMDMNEIRACDPEITAFVMLKMYVALASDWQRSHPKLAKEQIATLFQLYLMDGLGIY
ncbi:HTH-type transcriptional repressor Bm3R1 [compost metagenome]